MKVWNYKRTPLADSRYEARIEVEGFLFIKFAGKWEFYRVQRNGMERFDGYATDARQIRVLDHAAAAPSARSLDGKILPYDTELGFAGPPDWKKTRARKSRRAA